MKIKMNRIIKKSAGLLGTTLLAVLLVSPAQAGLIDGFGDDSAVVTINSGVASDSTTNSDLTNSSFAGIDREISLVRDAAIAGPFAANAFTFGGVFNFSNDVNVMSTATLTYTDFLADVTGTILGLEILTNDNGFTYTVSASSAGGAPFASSSQAVGAGIIGSLAVAFGGLLPAANVDLTIVNWLQVSFEANSALDLEADFLAEVPEPGLLSLLSIGLLGLGLSSRRRKIAA